MRFEVIVWLSLLGVASETQVFAQGSSTASAEDRASVLAQAALTHYEAGNFSAALESFQKARALADSPVLGLYSARSLVKLGRLLEARELLKEITNAPPKESLPEVVRAALGDAARDLRSVSAMIPSVEVALEGTFAAPRLEIDGKKANTGRTELDPGTHSVILYEGAEKLNSESFTLAIDEHRTFNWSAPVPTDGGARGPLWPGIALASLGGATLVAGGIFGGLAISDRDALDAVCVDISDVERRCPHSAQDTLDSAYTNATVSTALLITGGVLAAGGITLAIWRPGGTTSPTATALDVVVAPQRFVVSGRF